MIQYYDHSALLDHRLYFIGEILQELETGEFTSEFGLLILETLQKRMALEHVFLERPLLQNTKREENLRAEVWKLQKIKAKAAWATRPRKV